MSTLSAGAVAGLLVALMVASTHDSFGAPLAADAKDNGVLHPGDASGFNPQPDPPRQSRIQAAQAA